MTGTFRLGQPGLELWLRVCYPVVPRVAEDASQVYDRLRRDAGGMNYQDLFRDSLEGF